MTSSNVSNLLVQVSQIKVDVQSSQKASADTKSLFDKTLKNVADSAPQLDVKAKDAVNPSTESINKPNPTADKISDSDSKNNEPEKMEVDSEVVEKVEDTLTTVKDVIETELDVSEEDFEKAMEELGFVMIDLLNPQNLAQLVANLTGETDSFALLLNDGFKSVLDQVNSLADQLIKETGFSLDQLKEMISTVGLDENQVVVTSQDTIEIAEEIVPKQAENEVEVITSYPQTQGTIVDKPERPTSEKPVVESLKDDETGVKIEAKETIISEKSDNDGFDFSKESKGGDSSKLDSFHRGEAIVRDDVIVAPDSKFEVLFNPENEVVSLPTGETVKAQDIANQLIEQARILTDAETTTMEMTLNPEGLGRIYMEVTQKGDEITARIFAENDAVKHALESQMANLRVELNNNSTKVTSIEVSVGTHEFERNLDENGKEQNAENHQNQQSSKRQSRIDINSLDDLSGVMTEEDMLIAQMMIDNGNSLDFQA